ncbi:anion permease [Bacillus haynesii]|uniref:anion permease n=1 Tax=Bacillus haynesii TaxID=1925021 RepID=UPI00227E2002|nr:anion permease [Bacillus haynesii]MCY8613336.1 anion permease [Bacillus haynesii]
MAKEKDAEQKSALNIIPLAVTILVGAVIWFIPSPAGLDPKAWHLFAIFVATIIGFISKPLPMGAIAVFALAITALTGTLSIEDTLSGFGNKTIWLIVIAFFISRGFIKTGLGARIAYLFVRMFGKKTLGLSYSLLVSDLILSPAIPSNTARAGGIIFPIIRSLSETFQSTPKDGTERRIGAFLLKVGFQGNLITSAMFLTAMAANPLIAKLAHDVAGVNLTWTSWAVAAIVPGLVSLIITPLVIYKLYPPEVKETPDAAKIATEKLKEMGPFKKSELSMVAVFLLVLFLWIFGGNLNIDATTTALIGLAVLLLTQVLTWDDIKKEQGAWDTLTWFAALVMLASFLNELGMVGWFSDAMKSYVSGFSWVSAFLILIAVYYYSHYFFASATAHISAMYSAFLAVIIAAGAPPLLAALSLAFFSNLFGSTTHYGAGAAPVFFGAGYIPQSKWWSIGFILSIVHIVTWLVVGGLWWKLLGIW